MEIVSRVKELYSQIDKKVAAFQLKSGLRCPVGCGACCPTGNVQVTILEMLPAAHEILKSGAAVVWLERIGTPSDSNQCVLFCSEPPAEAVGHCRFYQFRPAICRLFGFASVRRRTGTKALSICKRIRQTDPQKAAEADLLAEEAPCFIHYSARIYSLDPFLGTRLMPINTALRQALDRIGLRHAMDYRETLHDNTAA